jgi:uncharacterized protein DUF6980
MEPKLYEPPTYCCEEMAGHAQRTCDQHPDRNDCPDCVITLSKSQGYGIKIQDGGSAFYAIRFCPWCGTNLKPLPNS